MSVITLSVIIKLSVVTAFRQTICCGIHLQKEYTCTTTKVSTNRIITRQRR